MEMRTRKENNAAVVSLAGKMDATTAPEYEKGLVQLIAAGELRLVVDFQGVEYISSAGLRSILATAKILKGKAGRILFANVRGTVREVFDISGFDSIFKLYESVDAALVEMG